MSTQIEPLLTVADIETMPEDGNRYEVIEGELFVSKAPGLPHQRVSVRLTTNFETFLERNPIGVIWHGPGVIFSEISGVIPDLVYVSNGRLAEIASGDRITGAPDLIVEIVSPGADNEQRDRVAKRQLYAKYGVKEYWLADLSKRNVEVYVLRESSLILQTIFRKGEALTSSLLPGFKCEVADIFRM